jgi:hypothetical protein
MSRNGQEHSMTFEMGGQKRDRISGHLVPPATADDYRAEHPFFLAACPLSAMSYAWVPLAMVTSAIRRAARRRVEIRALERAFARTGQEAERQGPGWRPSRRALPPEYL